jgi:Lipocalin-like domain
MVFSVFATSSVLAQSTKDVIGTWQAVANVHTAIDGKKTDAFGSNPKGMAIFNADSHFALINVRPDLAKFASGNRSTGSVEENRAVVQGSLALFGYLFRCR